MTSTTRTAGGSTRRFELLPPPSYPEGAQAFCGRAGLKRWIAATQEIWDEWRLMAERFLVAGDQVVVLVRVIAQGHLSGSASIARRRISGTSRTAA